jgi:hypothetical protein
MPITSRPFRRTVGKKTGPGGVPSTVIRVPDREEPSAVTDHASNDDKREKARIRERRYRESHREELLAKNRAYHKARRKEIRERQRRNYLARREEILEGKRPYDEEGYKGLAQKARQRDALLRAEIFRHYGEVCACCGTSEDLTIDHVQGNGGEHRRALGYVAAGMQFYRWLRRNGFPDGYQTLCRRCNRSKGSSERCRLPHRPR